MKSLKMKLIYRKHKKAILGTLGAVLLAGLVFFFSYFHVTKVEVMGTARYTDEQVKEMALQGAFTDNSVLAVLLHSRVDVEGAFCGRLSYYQAFSQQYLHQCPGKEGGRLHSLSGQLYLF